MRRLSAVLLVVTLLASVGVADVPQMINYQGILVDAGGSPVVDPVSVVFTIYDAPTGGNPVWTETRTVDPDVDGTFDIILGEISPITTNVFSGPDRWLGIKVESDPEIVPRTRLTSVGYSHRIGTIDGAVGGIISGDVSIQSDLDVDGDLRVTGKATIGTGHTNTGMHAFVAGDQNEASGELSTVGGGGANFAVGDLSTIGGGSENEAYEFGSTVAGGMECTAFGDYTVISGGHENSATDEGATVGGGAYNSASDYGTVAGGSYNTVDMHSAIGGGHNNKGLGFDCTVAGGYNNLADAGYATIGGGQHDTASGSYSTVPGGVQNAAKGNYSFAAGRRAKAIHGGTFVWADQTNSNLSSTADNQFLVRASGGVHVADHLGDVRISMNPETGTTTTEVLEITGGKDLAEPFPVSDARAIPPGALLVIDDQNPGRLKMSDQPYDRRVAGVVSGAGGVNPGLTLNQDGIFEDGQYVALTGTVYALADVSNGSIEPGDMLTTSCVPGHAMKATDYAQSHGSIIGKAMSRLQEGQGLVLVLVNLQ